MYRLFSHWRSLGFKLFDHMPFTPMLFTPLNTSFTTYQLWGCSSLYLERQVYSYNTLKSIHAILFSVSMGSYNKFLTIKNLNRWLYCLEETTLSYQTNKSYKCYFYKFLLSLVSNTNSMELFWKFLTFVCHPFAVGLEFSQMYYFANRFDPWKTVWSIWIWMRSPNRKPKIGLDPLNLSDLSEGSCFWLREISSAMTVFSSNFFESFPNVVISLNLFCLEQ